MQALYSPISRTRPTSVVHFVSTFKVKTDTKWLLHLARHLDRSVFRLSVACFYEGGPIQAQLEALGVQTLNLDVPAEHDPRAILRARNYIEQCDAQIVHTHLLRADLMAGLAARWAAVPVIISTCYALGEYRREKKRRSDRLLDSVCSALPTHTLAVSKAVAFDCITRLHMDPQDVSVIHTGIDPPEGDFSAAASEFRAAHNAVGRPLVLTLSRLSYEKGIDVLIDAADELRTRVSDVRIVVLGEGPDRAALEQRIDRMGLRDVVTLAGFCPDVWPALAASDVVCLPSKSEGMPNALLEAMAMRKPVVASFVGGIPEAVIDEVNGLLAEPGDAAALAAGLARCLTDPTFAARLGEAAARTVHEKFLAKDAVARYAALYRQELCRRRSTRDFIAAAS
ncbi:MAG: hypothetical protein DCC65_16780 [Planctomycetota bacterium]|nr:MAG: hypothetical protein DCC65_16780 [Planctomycetota bacterium]